MDNWQTCPGIFYSDAPVVAAILGVVAAVGVGVGVVVPVVFAATFAAAVLVVAISAAVTFAAFGHQPCLVAEVSYGVVSKSMSYCYFSLLASN